MWNTYRATEAFEDGKPWLLRFFDRIRFYPVSSEDLRDFRAGFLEGRNRVEIERGTFRLRDYRDFLAVNAASIASFKARQQAAFDAERARWQESEANGRVETGEDVPEFEANGALPPGATAVESPVPGSVWKVLVAPGHEVSAGETLIIVESMKMEIAVCAPSSGRIAEVRCAEGRVVQLGQALVIMAEPPA
jgi:urea carboxylase